MKKIVSLLALVLLTIGAFAQSPEKLSYQAIVRDPGGDLLTNTPIAMQISILQGSDTGTAVYAETHAPSTNVNGLVTLEIGAGTTSDVFSTIDWSNGPYFIKTETDPAGGTNYTITGTSQILSSPYALHAKTAESVIGAGDGKNILGSIGVADPNADVVDPTEGDQWINSDTGESFIYQTAVWNQVPSTPDAKNFLGDSSGSGIEGSTAILSGMDRDPIEGDQWNDPANGISYIFKNGAWSAVPIPGENLKLKLDATISPTNSNDENEGYSVGSRWIDIANDKEYVCVDATASAAVWRLTSPNSTSDISEGSNLYYTDARADSRIAAQKGVANGLATLDAGGKIPASQLSLSSVAYQGTWNANTNTPVLVDGVGSQGNYYVISVSGTTNLDGINDWQTGDWVIFNGTVWEKADHTDLVTSVAGKQGAVTLQLADITDLADTGDLPEGSNLYFTEARVDANSSVATNTAKVSADGSITTHSDVVVTSVTDNEVLAYDTATSKWVNQTPAEAGFAAGSHVHDASDINTGTFSDARIAESNVTQHESAINIGSLIGAPVGPVVGTTDTQILVNKTISTLNNTLIVATGDITTGTMADARIAESNVTQHEGSINHDNLIGFVSNEHIDHSAVSVVAGVGLTGGGTIAATRTIDLDVNGLATDAIPDGAADYVITYDASAADHKKVLIQNLPGTGESNTASSSGGISIVKSKVGVDLPFKGLTASSTKITLTSNTNDIGIDVNQGNITGTGALNSGSITSGFGSIDTGASAITTTGQITSGQLEVNGYTQFNDMTAPANPGTGQGRLYKKTGDDGLYWKPDAAGSEVDLTISGANGEINTASNVGSGGIGVFKQKVGNDLEFKKINAGSNKVIITDDTGNNEIDVDLVESNISIGNLSGAPTGTVVGTTDTQTLTNKTLTSPTNNIAANSLNSATTAINVSSATAPTSGQVLTATSGTSATWQSPAVPVYGSNFHEQSSDGQSATTSTILQTKTTLTTASLPAGTYRLGYSFEVSNAANAVLTEVEVKLDGVIVAFPTSEADNDFKLFGGFVYQGLSGVITATISYKTQTTGTALIRRARLELWRVN